ncbi:MAG: DNA sulfur modification protein DndD [bacterium]
MQFKSITINNLFAYYGKNTIELGYGEDCNITLLMGRNGFGKTSFINSVKMLFGGISDDLRYSVRRKNNRTPTVKQFITGINNEWWGILNQTAKQNNDFKCSISAHWLDHNENAPINVKAIREWEINFVNDSYQDRLIIEHEIFGSMEKDKAEEYLQSLLPTSYIPFFFFDGEKIQELAEDNNNEDIKIMELLLNIKPLENMQNVLDDLARSWRKEAASAEEQAQYNNKERQLDAKKDQVRALEQQLSDTVDEISEEEDHLSQVGRQLDLLRSGNISQQKEAEIRRDLQHSESRKQEALESLAGAWKRDAFLCMTPVLQKRLLKRLEPLFESGVGEQEELLEAVRNRIQAMFTTMPFPTPRLQESQVQFYKKRVDRELSAFSVNEVASDFDVTNERGKNLYQQLGQYGKGNSLLRTMLSALETAQSATKDVRELDGKLKMAGGLSAMKQQEHDELITAERVIKDKLLDLDRRKRSIEDDLAKTQKSINTDQNELNNLLKNVNAATEKRKQLNFVVNLRKSLEDVKHQLRKEKRRELEDNYNRLLGNLLTSHGLVNRVEIDEYFKFKYLEENGNIIGTSTMSSGMNQLLITALLWALKETSERELPIIIDTPMGRIDRQHQNNLLRNYYPKVAKQVVLLPTDSELDREKYMMLKQYICKEYYLENTSGKAAKIIEGRYYG